MHRILRFKHHLRVEPCDGERVFLISERERFMLQGRAYALLAPLIDGRRNELELIQALAGRLSGPEVYYALMLLEEQGFLVETGGPSHLPWRRTGSPWESPRGSRRRGCTARASWSTRWADWIRVPWVRALEEAGARGGGGGRVLRGDDAGLPLPGARGVEPDGTSAGTAVDAAPSRGTPGLVGTGLPARRRPLLGMSGLSLAREQPGRALSPAPHGDSGRASSRRTGRGHGRGSVRGGARARALDRERWPGSLGTAPVRVRRGRPPPGRACGAEATPMPCLRRRRAGEEARLGTRGARQPAQALHG